MKELTYSEEVVVKVSKGDSKDIYIKCINADNEEEYSTYRVRINTEAVRGEMDDTPFLYTTTGYSPEEDE